MGEFFRYEKLLNIYYHYGIIGHSKNSCIHKGLGKKENEEPQCGIWLKAIIGKLVLTAKKNYSSQSRRNTETVSTNIQNFRDRKNIEKEAEKSPKTESLDICGSNENFDSSKMEDVVDAKSTLNQLIEYIMIT
ncbi:hypothetical protein ACH5RR_029843 [Cinchona calisaya]|uniref:Uncharacterized protein n=1 Tax=Cinchona calisaya TaxID=153742 RepID=A0ABD2YW48_9GENT